MYSSTISSFPNCNAHPLLILELLQTSSAYRNTKTRLSMHISRKQSSWSASSTLFRCLSRSLTSGALQMVCLWTYVSPVLHIIASTSRAFFVLFSFVSIQVLCDNNTMVVLFHLESGLFDTLRCDRPVELGINFESLAKVLARVDDEKEEHLSSINYCSSKVSHQRLQHQPIVFAFVRSCNGIRGNSREQRHSRSHWYDIEWLQAHHRKIITIDAHDGRVEFTAKSE